MQDEVDDDDDGDDSLLAAVARIPVESRSWQPPAELDEYRLIEPLGRGGMGSVWLAQDRLLDRLVAVKFIAHGEPDQQTRDRFAVEARAAARLQHPNVVSVYRYGEIAGRPYLVAEYIRGQALDKLAKPVVWERVLELGIALARGLAAAHRHGIVHRDIKPANAIVTVDGDAKLVDFGLARLEAPKRPSRPSGMPGTPGELAQGSINSEGLTAPGAIAGTPRYLSPEVRRGEVADRRSDVYGIGCVLYELVIGQAPSMDFATGSTVDGGGPPDTPHAIRPIGDRIEGAGKPLAGIIDRCLRLEPGDRYASGDELREALEALVVPSGSRAELPEGNPYRGLVPFEAEHRALFFGRGPDIRAVLERLRADPFVVVAGDSGAGKSSLCRAGVLPAIADGQLADNVAWETVQLVPHHRPLTTLAAVLAPQAKLDEDVLFAMLRDEPARLPRELRRVRGDRTGIVVFVDQLEEVCTLTDRDEREAFARALEVVAGSPGLKLLASVRSDFLTRVAELPGIGPEVGRAIYLLRPLTAEGARDAVVGPARAKGARFESDELVDTLVASVTDTNRIELPLLAFTLAQLWEARTDQMISAKSLDAIGGVRGALARHADGVLDRLLPEQRDAARKLLLRLVTAEKTRARRTSGELGGGGPVLDALVRGRLVVARGEAFELAHERLIDGWPTLAAWVSDTSEAIAAHGRLAVAVADWERLGRTRDGLWGARQLADLELLDGTDLTTAETAFAGASRRSVWRKRWLRRSIAIAIPVIAVGVYAGAKIVARRDLDRHIDENVATADEALAMARAANKGDAMRRTEAFALFDKPDAEHAEAAWEASLEQSAAAREAYVRATNALEAAFILDTGRDETRKRLAEITFERVELAEREYRFAERDELLGRLPLYDPDGLWLELRAVPARVYNGIVPRVDVDIFAAPFGAPVATGGPPVARVAGGAAVSVPPGSYVAITRGPIVVRQPVVATFGGAFALDFELPKSIPSDYVFVPAGTVLYGSREDEFMRHFYDTQPMHSRKVRSFLIGRTEVTYAQWIEFLSTLAGPERTQRAPHVDSASDIAHQGGELELRAVDNTWELHFVPNGVPYTVRAGARVTYRDRTRRREQDWLRFPVAGVSTDDALAYAAWLDKTGKLPHARLCTEIEWERAARGADARSYLTGDKLDPDDANVDVTYDRKPGGMGPDEVGSHPASNSPFGVADLAGNLWDLVRAVDGSFVMRGGAYFINPGASHVANRQAVPSGFRHPHTGVRICADP